MSSRLGTGAQRSRGAEIPGDAVLELRVDPVACEAFGYCSELLPELIALDEWGYPILLGTGVPSALAPMAREAALRCPRRALLVSRRRPGS
jgi:ferredoxin